VLSMPRVKTSLNRLIDDMVHPRGRPRDLGTIVVDEVLHSVIEGGFRLDKFLRYTVLPQLRIPVGQGRLRRRKRRKDQTLLLLPQLPQHNEGRERVRHATALLQCARCKKYVQFGLEVWVDGKPYCGTCALIRAGEGKG